MTATELIVRYKTGNLTERERADAEAEIFETALREDHTLRATRRGEWLAENLGELASQLVQRHYLRSKCAAAGEIGATIWARVDDDMALRTAVWIVRHAYQSTGDLAENVRKELAAYDALPGFRREANGKGTRFTPPTSLRARDTAPKKRQKPQLNSVVREVVGRAAWDAVNEILGSGKEGDPVVCLAIDGLTAEIGATLAGFKARLAVLRRGDQIEAAANLGDLRRQALGACRVLGIPAPAPNKPADMVAAKRNWKNLVRHYHPDTSNGNTQEAYQGVIEAFNVLKLYSDIITKEIGHGSNNRKRKNGNDDGESTTR